MTQTVEIDKIEILANGIIQCRQATKYLDDNGVEQFKKYHRWSLTPGQDITTQQYKVQQICNTVWTPEIVTNYQNNRGF